MDEMDESELKGTEEKASPSNGQARERGGVISRDEVRQRGDGVNRDGHQRNEGFWMTELRRFLVCLMFLTRLPCPRWVDHRPADLVPGMMYFPMIGAFVGLFCFVVFDALVTLWHPILAATGSTLAGVWVTGCFHEDGLADVLDSFGGGWTAAQILTIMKDSRVGTYAVVGVSLFIVAKVTAISIQKDTLTALICGHSIARLTALYMVKWFPYIQDEEDDKGLLYNSYAGCINAGLLTWPRVFVSTVFTSVLTVMLIGFNVKLLALCMCFVIFSYAAGKYAMGVIKGVIGDFLGAMIVLAELLVYMFLAIDLEDFTYGPWLRLAIFIGIPAIYMNGAGELPKAD